MSLIEAVEVWKEFPQPGEAVIALRDISLEIMQGEFVVVTGESGSGKSTLLSLLGSLDRPTRGSIQFWGESLDSLSAARLNALRSRHIGFVFQDFRLVRHLSAIDNVRLPMLFSGRDYSAQAAAELVGRFHMTRRAAQRPDSLSRGEMQRIALARALINRPDVLFADEPTANLDRANAEIIWHHLSELNRRDGLTVIVATHNLELASHAGRLLTLQNGRLVSDEKRPMN